MTMSGSDKNRLTSGKVLVDRIKNMNESDGDRLAFGEVLLSGEKTYARE